MKKKKFLRLSKRIMILALCTCLISGSCFQRYKITANATSVAVTATAYTAYEICLYLGSLLLASLGTGLVIENRDEIAEIGKKFIDSVSFDDAPDWVIHKATAAGQQQVIGREVFDYIRAMAWSAVLAGGSSPENNNNDDDDDDEPEENPEPEPEPEPEENPDLSVEEAYQARTDELSDTALVAAPGFLAVLSAIFAPLIEQFRNGEETFLDEIVDDGGFSSSFNGFKQNEQGLYLYSLSTFTSYANGDLYSWKLNSDYKSYNYKQCLIYDSVDSYGCVTYRVYAYNNDSLTKVPNTVKLLGDTYQNGEQIVANLSTCTVLSGKTYVDGVLSSTSRFETNLPVFDEYSIALYAMQNNDFSGAVGRSKFYRIADWLQEDWSSVLGTLHGGVFSLATNAAVVGEAVNRALQNQLDGKGYIEALNGAIAATEPLPLPGTLQDPIYIPSDSPAPKLDPGDFPWPTPDPVPDPSPVPVPDPAPDDPDPPGADPKSTFGLNTIFGTLILLIMIIIMLLIIFISCLAFIVMVFRIEATTGFLPDEMVAALDYLKTLQIPGFGMSVYSFFMALIYILLIFSVIGILRKNIDKIKFPRPGKR